MQTDLVDIELNIKITWHFSGLLNPVKIERLDLEENIAGMKHNSFKTLSALSKSSTEIKAWKNGKID